MRIRKTYAVLHPTRADRAAFDNVESPQLPPMKTNPWLTFFLRAVSKHGSAVAQYRAAKNNSLLPPETANLWREIINEWAKRARYCRARMEGAK